jgi:hypothetical protein
VTPSLPDEEQQANMQTTNGFMKHKEKKKKNNGISRANMIF